MVNRSRLHILFERRVSRAFPPTTCQPHEKTHDRSEEQEEETNNERASRRDRRRGQCASHYERQDRSTASAHRHLQAGVSPAHQPAQLPSPARLYTFSSQPVKGIDMRLDRLRLIALSLVIALGIHTTAQAVSMRPNKATDDSVCDLAHNTTGYLGSVLLIPAGAAPKDQIDAFFRLAATFVTSKCSNGQLLILQGLAAVSVDPPSLIQVANSACASARVKRSEVAVPLAGQAEPGFELRCEISKREELAAKLAELERADSMESLKARLATAARDPGSTARASGSSTEQKKDCGQVTLASLLQGGGCKK
jgi:hypothetical protein